MTKGLRLSAGSASGIVCLVALAAAVAILPGKIKSSTTGLASELRARESLRQVIREELSQDLPQQSAELAPTHKPKAASKCPVADEVVPEDLRFGRVLVAKGKPETAIPYYKRYIALDPDKIPARLELISAYIAAKQMHEARLLCIRTMKKDLSAEDNARVWQRLSQCQTD